MSLESRFDVLVYGTGLPQSIAAAALAQAGYNVLHIDPNLFYGSRQASLTVKELLELGSSQSSRNCDVYSSFSYHFAPSCEDSPLLTNSRHYAISLCPSLIPSEGNLIGALVKSGVSRYGEFRLLDALGVIRMSGAASAELHRVPSTKEDIFKDKDISLITKRKFMKMLQFAIGEYEGSDVWKDRGRTNLLEFLRSRFNIPPEFASAIALSVAFSPSHEPVEPALARLRRYARSAGRYGKSPFLVGNFGGLGEMAQWFCRSCAVNGGTYMLGKPVQSIQLSEHVDSQPSGYSVTIEGIPNSILVSCIIWPDTPTEVLDTSCPSPEKSIIRGIVVVDQPVWILDSHGHKITFGDGVDNVTMVFDPSYMTEGSKDGSFVTCFLTGHSTMSCPKGQVIVYLSSIVESTQPQDPEAILRPYVGALLRGSSTPLLELYYREALTARAGPFNIPIPRGAGCFLVDESPPEVAVLTETGDVLASRATALFWEVSTFISRSAKAHPPEYMWATDRLNG